MKIILNKYETKDITKILREWTELTQQEFAETVNRSKDSIKKIEVGQRNIYLHTLIEWANIHGILWKKKKDLKGLKKIL